MDQQTGVLGDFPLEGLELCVCFPELFLQQGTVQLLVADLGDLTFDFLSTTIQSVKSLFQEFSKNFNPETQ